MGSLEELDTIRRKLKFSIFAIHLCKFVLILGWRRFATGPDLVVSSADVVSDKGRQRTIDLFCLLWFILGVVTSCGLCKNGCARYANYCRVSLNLCLVGNHILIVVAVGVSVWLLESHGVVRSSVLSVCTYTEVASPSGPWRRLVELGLLGEFTDRGTGAMTKARLVLTHYKVVLFQSLHHFVGLLLIKLAFMCHRPKILGNSRFLKAWMMDEVSGVIFGCVW